MEWCLTKKENTVVSNGKTYHGCTGDHYSGGTKYDGMYADHKSCNHDAWQTCINMNCNAKTNTKTTDEIPKSADVPTQKLPLNYKL